MTAGGLALYALQQRDWFRFFFLATVFCATFEKIHWDVAGSVSLADVLAIGFIVCFALQEIARRDRRFVVTAAVEVT